MYIRVYTPVKIIRNSCIREIPVDRRNDAEHAITVIVDVVGLPANVLFLSSLGAEQARGSRSENTSKYKTTKIYSRDRAGRI